MDHYVAYMESEIRALRLERDLLQARTAQQAAEVERLKADREHYRVLWEDEHCPTCYGPCAGCDDA